MERAQTRFQRRLLVVASVFLSWAGLIVAQLVNLQILDSHALQARAHLNHKTQVSIPAKRGSILDCRGKILAMSQIQPSVCADPSMLEDADEAVAEIADILGRNEAWKRTIRKRLADKERSFAYVERWVSPAQWEQIKALSIQGLFCQMEPLRKYPKDWLASHILGFTSLDGSLKEGTEASFDLLIGGVPGTLQTIRDGRQKRIWLGPTVVKEPVVGADVVLTVDENIQFFVEQALRRAMKRTRAKNITAIVMDPRDGAIKAMANMPDFNPNLFYKARAFERKNRGVVDVYEPASAFKMFVVAAALEYQALQLDSVVDCQRGGIKVSNTFIRDHRPFDRLRVEEVLWYSSNVGAIKVGQTLTDAQFFEAMKRFGFGERTGVDLPAEACGIVHPLKEWTGVSKAFLSIGHEISATSLQVLTAACSIANGGYRVIPHVGDEVVHGSGRRESLALRTKGERIIEASTAEALKRALEGVVLVGTAKSAAIPGVRVFGKTGTAQRVSGRSYSKERFNASFVGFFPLEAPRYGIIVVVHDPKSSNRDGGAVAAPVFSEIGRQIVWYESDMPGVQTRRLECQANRTPDWGEQEGLDTMQPGIMPDLRGMGLRNAFYRCYQLGIQLEVEGEGVVDQQIPPAGVPIQPGETCKVALREG